MKKLLFILSFSAFLMADIVDDGIAAANKGDYKKAFSLWQKACDGGIAMSCNNLGSMYYNGQGVKQNKAIAKEYYGKACDMGIQDGCDNYKILNKQGY